MTKNLIKGKTGPWEIVIGLEVHAQISSKSKLFSGSATEGDGGANSRVNFFDAGMPGMLPVVNSYCIDQAVRMGFGIHGKINKVSVFDRKNYFYPDLPSGYQISQFFYPIVTQGYINIDDETGPKRIGVTRIHMEQDAGKSQHDLDPSRTCIDLNRSGIALMEIVTEPDIRSVAQAVAVAKKIHTLAQYLDVCDGNMERGNFRIDANISLHRPDTAFGTRVEIKNLNSFRFMQAALNYEIDLHLETLESGGKISQETRLFDAAKGKTFTMRDKEDACDYRYFPDPDLNPVVLTEERIERLRQSLPELPDAKKERYKTDLGLSDYDATFLAEDRALGAFYEEALAYPDFPDKKAAPKLVAHWMMGDMAALMNKGDRASDALSLAPRTLAQLVHFIQDGTISGKIAKTVFEKLWEDPALSVVDIVKNMRLQQISDETELRTAIVKMLAEQQHNVAEYRNGKTSLFGFFVGQTMKIFQGKANPAKVNEILHQELDS
ncbi:aspartyl/glutamyl-tRNA(Asn/Gln) amidotransferase subunit B [Alphaproteobacteria bacterium]|nr:aspartyl/glutamyl-tRNA(Asn/Gln) amidotransferase subunit B [Alphaproteobacteria bacterium]GHS97613.1 aspartyl/glutamyl-tRNA(Asn/Gln) amidotransferase subunit B [Alphaproteobacteria bacterium]